jgi:hypothetical protein
MELQTTTVNMSKDVVQIFMKCGKLPRIRISAQRKQQQTSQGRHDGDTSYILLLLNFKTFKTESQEIRLEPKI